MSILTKIFGNKNQRELKKLHPLVQKIGELGATMEAKSDAELQAFTPAFKTRLDQGASLDDILPEAFAVVREAAWRVMKMKHYDVQLVGGMVMHSGRIAEMRTGEGKTLTATAPVYLNALEGKGAHLITVNDYLATRDAEWMGQVYRFLGLSVGCIHSGIRETERQKAYRSDITYGQNSEFGFDYLRDNMKSSPDQMVQRGLRFAVVDEVDSILIDEARTPLIISGPAEQSSDLYSMVDKIIPRLKRDIDYTVDEENRSSMLTDAGNESIEKLLELDNLYDPKNIRMLHHVHQALRAHTLYKRDVNYLVEDGKVLIIDEFTGRKMPGRRWSDGLHQSIEAKENVVIEEENQTLATVTYQNFFRMYDKLSGMTGTADTEAAEFNHIYKLDVVVIPTNKPTVRKDAADLIYKNEKGKFKAVFEEIVESYKVGQPVLVGTTSVEKSEVIAKLLKGKNIPFEVLNAKQHEREAGVVAQAGRKGAITISTNMAGRGTDIVLGGNAEALSIEKAKAEGREDDEEYIKTLFAQFEPECTNEKQEVLAAGGLKIIGTERHESRRIDNQLRGRAGRQGDPGASRFYLSLDDDLMRIFGGERVTNLMEKMGMEEDVPIEHPWVTKSIENAQKKVEGSNFDSRKNVLEYDDVMNQQRKTLYGLRKQILKGEYIPTLSEEDIEKGEVAEAPQTAGDWTKDSLRPIVEPDVQNLFDGIESYEQERKQAQEQSEQDETEFEGSYDMRPSWRLFRTELWRQNGCWVDDLGSLWEKHSKAELKPLIVDRVSASLIQQKERLYDLCDTLIGTLVDRYCPMDIHLDEWKFDELEQSIQSQFNIQCQLPKTNIDQQAIAEAIWTDVEKHLVAKEKDMGKTLLLAMRHFYLQEIDRQWTEHLKTMEQLRQGIGLRGYGQKDPKKEYKKEGFEIFAVMMQSIEEHAAQNTLRAQIQKAEEVMPDAEEAERETYEMDANTQDGEESAPPPAQQQRAKSATMRRDRPKVGRNDPCPCGSGKKYKKCHGKETSPTP